MRVVRPSGSGVLQPFKRQVCPLAERQVLADTVEKVALWFLQSAREKNDLSDRPTNRSRAPVEGKKTPANLAKKTVSDFFNSIGRLLPVTYAARSQN